MGQAAGRRLADGLVQGVERAGADVAEHHADGADRQREEAAAVGVETVGGHLWSPARNSRALPRAWRAQRTPS